MELRRWPTIQPLLPHLAAAVKSGAGKEVLEHYMQKIYTGDGEVNAVVESLAPDVLGKTSCSSGSANFLPLEGLPFLVKDNMHVKGFHTVCGSKDFINNPPAEEDCKFVARLRELGGIPVGKTNLPYLGMDVQTYNDVYGTTNNPYNVQLTAGGSSGGSCAAVAIGMAPFAVGNDLNGSLRIPAAFCGVCSLHATRGRISLDKKDEIYPHVPMDPIILGQLLVAGVFTTNVADLKFCLQPLLQSSLEMGMFPDPMEAAASPINWADTENQSSRPDQEVTLGVVTSFSGISLDHRIEEALQMLPRWLKDSPKRGGPIELMAEVTGDFALDLQEIREAMDIFGKPFLMPEKVESEDFETNLVKARAIQARTTATVDAFLTTKGFSALLLPVCAILPCEHNYKRAPALVNGVNVPWWEAMLSYVQPFTLSGNPVVTIPLCLIDGLPCGVQVVGKMGCDEELLNICLELERQLASDETVASHPLKFPTPADFRL